MKTIYQVRGFWSHTNSALGVLRGLKCLFHGKKKYGNTKTRLTRAKKNSARHGTANFWHRADNFRHGTSNYRKCKRTGPKKMWH